jgi:hypothetical protein
MPYDRDSDELKAFLRQHRVSGYEVTVPHFGRAVIEGQAVTGGGHIFYRVRAAKPVPFHAFAELLHASETPLTLAEWKEQAEKAGRRFMPVMQEQLQDILETGGKVSERDRLFAQLIADGCVDVDQKVTCYSFPAKDVVIAEPRKGLVVEEVDGDGTFPGRIVGLQDGGKTILLEVFAPVPFMRAPAAIMPEKIRPGYYSSRTWSLGYGSAQALEDQGSPLPKGKWTEDEQEYLLDELLDLSVVEDLCRRSYAEEPHCVWQAMVLFIVPVDRDKARFHPLPEGADPDEFVVEYEG